MFPRPFAICLGLVAALLAPMAGGAESERNFWPVSVTQAGPDGTPLSWQRIGPFWFSQPEADGGTAHGFRPIWVARDDAEGRRFETTFLYPLFTARARDTSRGWSLIHIVNSYEPQPGTDGERGFDFWPFYFSRNTGSPDTSYRAFFPFGGTVLNRFYREKVSWVLFPLYLRTENRGVTARAWLWPFLHVASGAGTNRFSIWPFYSRLAIEGQSRHTYVLWPFYYHNFDDLDQAVPTEKFGVLPFYASEDSADVHGRTYLWPFFGTTDRTAPYRYHETRYFWPLFVQGRGEGHYRNRWGPFYTHSIMSGDDKTWILWPVYRREQWSDATLTRTQVRVLYFLYRSESQRAVGAAPGAPTAYKEHLWPLYSRWDNGAGHRQFQLLSPFASFFPNNDSVRLGWTPLFALYRRDEQASGATRQSWLFDLVTLRRDGDTREFHLGPVIGVTRSDSEERIALAGGLLRLRHDSDSGWRANWFDFSGESDHSSD